MASEHPGSDSLLEFLRSTKTHSKKGVFDPKKTKEEWVADLKELMQRLRSFAAPAVKRRLLTIKTEKETIREDQLGTYQVPRLRLIAPNNREVETLVRGRYVVGALGRVDLASGPKTAMLVRTGPGEWVFKLKLTPTSWESAPLNERTLSDVLVDLLK